MNQAIMSLHDELRPLNPFLDKGFISEVLYRLKSGKEATVFCCRGGPAAGADLVAAKIYRSNRSFKNDAVYQEGRVVLDARMRRAVKKKSRTGREGKFSNWVGSEYATLEVLHAEGADVPRPIAQQGSAVLMQYFGDEEGPAPLLRDVRLERQLARPFFYKLVDNIALFLACNCVHGDLSPYNILYAEEKLSIIDFPQAVDARSNRHARELLVRDLENVYGYFARLGVEANTRRIADGLWHRFMHAAW